MTLTEIYKSLDCNLPVDKIILDILKEETKKSAEERIKVDMERIDDLYTICEVIREIFKRTDDIEIQKRCLLAQLYAKKMARKLKYYFDKDNKSKDLNHLFFKKKNGNNKMGEYKQ